MKLENYSHFYILPIKGSIPVNEFDGYLVTSKDDISHLIGQTPVGYFYLVETPDDGVYVECFASLEKGFEDTADIRSWEPFIYASLFSKQ